MRPQLAYRISILLPFIAGLWLAAGAQSSARPSPVEVLIPKPPTPATIEGREVLVYELHITNFGPSALKLTAIQVFGSSDDDPDGGEELADYKDAALSPLLRPVVESPQGDPAQLEIGRRVIAFMYLTVPSGKTIRALRHRFSFDVADSSRAKGTANDETALDGVMVPVLRPTAPVLTAPFKNGTWLAGNGPSNSSVHRRSVMALAGRTFLSQRFAIDWVMVGENGDSVHGSRDRNENFWAFGQPVIAVADGEVSEVLDGILDNVPGQLPLVTVQNILGNHVILQIAPGVYVTFAHLKEGSIGVRLHQKVKRGDRIALVGNSGNSTGSHLHFQVTDGNSALASEGIPFKFERFTYMGLGKDYEQDHHPEEPRSQTLPMDDSVVSFR